MENHITWSPGSLFANGVVPLKASNIKSSKRNSFGCSQSLVNFQCVTEGLPDSTSDPLTRFTVGHFAKMFTHIFKKLIYAFNFISFYCSIR